MGSRGASSGIANNGKKYGTEYRTILQSGNIKFIKYNISRMAKTPMETMTGDRIYVTVNSENKLKSITFYDNNKRYKQIDISGRAHVVNGKKRHVHTHVGFNHDEQGTRAITKEEWQIIRRIKHIWYNNIKGE